MLSAWCLADFFPLLLLLLAFFCTTTTILLLLVKNHTHIYTWTESNSHLPVREHLSHFQTYRLYVFLEHTARVNFKPNRVQVYSLRTLIVWCVPPAITTHTQMPNRKRGIFGRESRRGFLERLLVIVWQVFWGFHYYSIELEIRHFLSTPKKVCGSKAQVRLVFQLNLSFRSAIVILAIFLQSLCVSKFRSSFSFIRTNMCVGLPSSSLPLTPSISNPPYRQCRPLLLSHHPTTTKNNWMNEYYGEGPRIARERLTRGWLAQCHSFFSFSIFEAQSE